MHVRRPTSLARALRDLSDAWCGFATDLFHGELRDAAEHFPRDSELPSKVRGAESTTTRIPAGPSSRWCR